jgi:prevent-host-death family protein
MDVGIRELKARLSEFVDRAARGEVVRVTDRGVPRALLVPVGSEDRLRQGIAEGWITRGSSQPPGPHRPLPPLPGTPSSSEILAQDRA